MRIVFTHPMCQEYWLPIWQLIQLLEPESRGFFFTTIHTNLFLSHELPKIDMFLANSLRRKKTECLIRKGFYCDTFIWIIRSWDFNNFVTMEIRIELLSETMTVIVYKSLKPEHLRMNNQFFVIIYIDYSITPPTKLFSLVTIYYVSLIIVINCNGSMRVTFKILGRKHVLNHLWGRILLASK